jgi:hypothetical protein
LSPKNIGFLLDLGANEVAFVLKPAHFTRLIVAYFKERTVSKQVKLKITSPSGESLTVDVRGVNNWGRNYSVSKEP